MRYYLTIPHAVIDLLTMRFQTSDLFVRAELS